jgi:uroporphyrinogen decarboxylase
MKSPEELKNFIKQVEKLNISTIKQAADQGINGIILADDVAYTRGLLTNPKILREYFLPSLANQVKEITRLGLPVFYHCDGDYHEIIPDLIDMHIQGLNALSIDAVWILLHC